MNQYKELSEIDAKYREDVDLGHKTLCIDTDDYIALYNMAEYSEILMQEEDAGRAVTIDSYVGELEHRIKHYHNLLESLSDTHDIASEIMKEQPDKKIINANDLLQYILRKINDELEGSVS